VISGFINSELNSRNYPDFICCIYPVTPLLTSNRLQEGYFLVAQNPLNFVFSAVPANSPPERIFRLSEKLEPIFGTANQIDVRTQDLTQQFNDAGQFYWGATSLWLSQDSIIGRYSKAVKLGKHEVIDVDENNALAAEYGIRGVPTLIMLEENIEVKRMSGNKTVEELKEWVGDGN
jgi:N-acylneuraminate cytidylyltransferase